MFCFSKLRVLKKNRNRTVLLLKIFPSFIIVFLLFLIACGTDDSVFLNKVIVIDPGHGGTAEVDTFRVGPKGEREEWINLRVALELEKLLSEQGANVVMTRVDDTQIDLADRAELALENDADLFLSIHHNATADPGVNFPIVYYHGNASENEAGVALAKIIAEQIKADLFDEDTPSVIASDHTIFPNSGTGVLRRSYGIPGVIAELSFFTNPEEEVRLRNEKYNRLQAESLLKALSEFFEEDTHTIYEKHSKIELPPFAVYQEGERMSPEAMNWREYYEQARGIYDGNNIQNFERAYELATLSVRSFPDSPVAREAHLLRAKILDDMGRSDEAVKERRRANQFYVE